METISLIIYNVSFQITYRTFQPYNVAFYSAEGAVCSFLLSVVT